AAGVVLAALDRRVGAGVLRRHPVPAMRGQGPGHRALAAAAAPAHPRRRSRAARGSPGHHPGTALRTRGRARRRDLPGHRQSRPDPAAHGAGRASPVVTPLHARPAIHLSRGASMKHVFACLTASTLLCASPAVAAQDSRAVLQAATADAIRDHCLARAAGAGVPVAVAVFDHGGDLVSFGRHDGTTPATGAVAQWKGRSAAVYLNPTAVTGTWNVPTAPMIATAEGGVPLF